MGNQTQFSNQQVVDIGSVLNNPERPLKERFRALFTLKNIGGLTAVKEIANCFKDESALLKHELAYCLGQMQDNRAVPYLEAVLKDVHQEAMVRHEAGKFVILEIFITVIAGSTCICPEVLAHLLIYKLSKFWDILLSYL